MLKIQNYQLSNRIQFKSQKQNPTDADPNTSATPVKTHSGLKVGAIQAALGSCGLALEGLSFYYQAKTLPNQRFLFDLADDYKAFGNRAFASIPLFIGAALTIGSLFDNKINEKHKKLQEQLAKEDKIEVLKNNNETTGVAANGKVYYKSNIGTKHGAIIGAIACPLLNAVRGRNTISSVIINICAGTLGGWALGYFTDKWSARDAKKQAETAK